MIELLLSFLNIVLLSNPNINYDKLIRSFNNIFIVI